MLQNALPLKTIILLLSVVMLMLIATIFAIVKYDSYAYETTSINAKDNWVKAYSDSIDHGNSRVKKIETEQEIGFDCTIKAAPENGTAHPYCIMLNWISINEFQGLDLSDFRYMRLYASYDSPNENDFLRISLRHFDIEYTQVHKPHTYKYNLIEIKKKDIFEVVEIDLSELVVPQWWVSMMKGQNTNNFVELSNIPLLEISTGTHATFGEHKFRISKIEFDKEIISIAQVYEYIVAIWGLFISVILTILSIYFAIILRIKIRNERNLIQINQALAKRSKELEYVNKTDELTGVLNRAGMQAKMLECIKNQISPITLVMIDIDLFKSINDTLGHNKGDIVLNTFGKILMNFTNINESVSRFGGEEFILLMQNQTTEQAKEKVEKIRKHIAEYDFNIDRQVTASFGMATATGKIDFKSLIEQADGALYVAKNNGRNCIKSDKQL